MEKRYYNAQTKEWYNEGSAMTRKVDKGVFSGIPMKDIPRYAQAIEWINN